MHVQRATVRWILMKWLYLFKNKVKNAETIRNWNTLSEYDESKRSLNDMEDL